MLGEGATTAGHIDAVTRVARKLPEARRGELLDRADALANVAAVSTVEQFAKRVALEAQRIESGDGLDRLERQRRATRLRSWVDDEGMWNVRGRFDPVTGVRLDAKLHATVEALFAESTPQGCPDDAIEKQQFLAAHALTRLLDGAGGSKPGRAEYLVVVDADATDQSGPVAQWSIPVEIPARVLAELADDGDISAVVVRNGVVLHAPGELNLGRTTRLANRAQRRALRGLYRCCAIPGCNVGYDRCELHHVLWWRQRRRQPISTTCSRSVRSITARSTTTAGPSNSDPTANSPSASRMDRSTTPDHQTDAPPPERRSRFEKGAPGSNVTLGPWVPVDVRRCWESEVNRHACSQRSLGFGVRRPADR